MHVYNVTYTCTYTRATFACRSAMCSSCKEELHSNVYPFEYIEEIVRIGSGSDFIIL